MFLRMSYISEKLDASQKVKLQHAFYFYFLFSLALLHSKKFWALSHQKEALICWLQKFVLCCTIFWCFYWIFLPFSGVTYHYLWCSIGRIFVASNSVLLFGRSKLFRVYQTFQKYIIFNLLTTNNTRLIKKKLNE